MELANEIEEEIETECCFLNSFGDISVKWKEKDNDTFIAEIDELIKKGYTFFILKKDKKIDFTFCKQSTNGYYSHQS